MRPPELPGGKSNRKGSGPPTRKGFNEAAGITRRKDRPYGARATGADVGFNEAAGITRRKGWPIAACMAASRSFNEAAGITRRKGGLEVLHHNRPKQLQ